MPEPSGYLHFMPSGMEKQGTICEELQTESNKRKSKYTHKFMDFTGKNGKKAQGTVEKGGKWPYFLKDLNKVESDF